MVGVKAIPATGMCPELPGPCGAWPICDLTQAMGVASAPGGEQLEQVTFYTFGHEVIGRQEAAPQL